MGRKRHALVDTDGRGLVLFAHPASVQDRDGAGPLLAASRRPFPFIEKVFADAGRAGSVDLNSFGAVAKWVSALVMPPPGLAATR